MLQNRLTLVIASILFIAVFFQFSHPIELGDFWFHISNGRWIVEHGGLPDEDPFLYTVKQGPDAKRSMTLKGFWLAQVMMFLVYDYFGFLGIVVFKAALFTLIFFALYRIMRLKGVEPPIALIFIIAAVFASAIYEEARPHVFSFLFALIVLFCIEKGLDDLRNKRTEGIMSPAALAALPAVMVLWANLHPGFSVGIAMLSIYLFSETLKYVLKRNALSGNQYGRFASWILLAALCTLLNPNFHNPVYLVFTELGGQFVRMIEEYMSPFKYAMFRNDYGFLYASLIIGAVTLLIMLVSWRKLQLSHIMLYAGFAAAGMKYFRFSIFFVLISIAISSAYMGPLSARAPRFLRRVLSVCVLGLSIALFAFASRSSALISGAPVKKNFLPEAAAEFIRSNRPPGPLFNPYEWGGYITWELYPEYKVFIDSRTMDLPSTVAYLYAKSGLLKALSGYGVNTIFFYSMDLMRWESNVPGIVFSLLKDDDWQLVYFDRISVIFVQRKAASDMPVIEKEGLWRSLMNTAGLWAESSPRDVRPLIMLGEIHYHRGDNQGALHYFNRAVKLDPANSAVWTWINRLKSSLPGEAPG